MKNDYPIRRGLPDFPRGEHRLFLTGPIGCGKSTAIRKVLGENLSKCGGFLTQRCLEPHLHFTLESPDGKTKKTFLDFAAEKPTVNLDVFSEISLEGRVLILDEIGGIELLNPKFTAALKAVLDSDIPVLGVIKGEGPASALIEALGLAEEYQIAASRLRQSLQSDPGTLVYQCSQYDESAVHLVRKWAEENLHD